MKRKEKEDDSDIDSDEENMNDDEISEDGDEDKRDEDDDEEDDDDAEGDDDDDDDTLGDIFPQENGNGAPAGVNGANGGNENDENDIDDDDDKDDAEPSSKRRRIVSKALTSEEASALTSAETSLTSNLFKFQTGEMLKEIRLDDDSAAKQIRPIVDRLKAVLTSSSSSKSAAESSAKMLQHINEVDGVKIPFRRFEFSSFKSDAFGGTFQFSPPASVGISGVFNLGAVCKPSIVVDVGVEIPKDVIQKKDANNFRYAFKRAIYLAHCAAILKKERNGFEAKPWKNVKFSFEREGDDPLRARLLLAPTYSIKEKKDLEIVFSIFCFTNENAHLEADKLRFEKSLVDPQWFFGADSVDAKSSTTSYAAHYENDLLRDLTQRRNQIFLQESVFAQAPNLRDGILLLRTWMRQRGLDGGGGVSSDSLIYLVAFLLTVKKTLSAELSAVQFFRKTLLAFSNGVFESGAGLCAEGDAAAERRKRLEEFFDVVVLDRTESCNLTPSLTKLALRHVGREARAALACLEAAHSQDAFEELFLHKIPPQMMFDQIFVISDSRGKGFEGVVEKQNLWSSLLRSSGSSIIPSTSFIMELVARALGRRVTAFAFLPPSTNQRLSWPLESSPSLASQSEIRIGLCLDVCAFGSIIEKGPAPEETEQVADFRRFWGSKVETRRFKDATIAEAVVWTAKNVEVKRRITVQILQHILSTHANIPSKEVQFIGDQVDKKILRFKRPKKDSQKDFTRLGTGEEQQNACLTALDAVSKTLRSLSEVKSQNALPLRITSVQGVAPVFRQTDPFPPPPSFYGQSASSTASLPRSDVTLAVGKKGAKVDDQLGDRIPQDVGEDGVVRIPDWVPALPTLLTLELSGKWPEDLEALRRVKSSFLASICKCLQEQKVSSTLKKDKVKVLMSGFVFELKIAHPRELALLKRLDDEEGEEVKENRDQSFSAKFQRQNFTLPHISSVINGLNAQFPAFSGTCRILKRWVASQLLIDFFPENGIALELIVAYVFLHPHPFASPAVTPQTGFLRALRLMSTWHWRTTPMVVNFNDELNAKEYRELSRNIATERRKLLEEKKPLSPSMLVVTPFDKTPSEWTVDGPPAFVLSRLVAVSKASLPVLLESMDPASPTPSIVFGNCLPAFRPPVKGFNVLIYLKKELLPTRHWSIDCMEPSEALTTHLKPRAKGLVPVNDFDPARRFLEILRRCYKDVCYFFHDPFGGDVIAVLWRPEIMVSRPMEEAMSTAGSRLPPGMRIEDKTVGALTGDVIEDLGKRKAHVEFNVQAFVDDVKILGDGIVEKVEMKTENWS